MRPETRKLVARLAVAACALAFAYVVVRTLSLPSPVSRRAPRQFEVAILPKAARLLPDTAAPPEPEPPGDVAEPLADVLPYVPRIQPFEIVPVPPPVRPWEGHVRPVIPVQPPAVRPIAPVPVEPLRPPRLSQGDVVRAIPPPRTQGGPRRLLEWAAPDEELWVIARRQRPARPADVSHSPGEVLATVPAEARTTPLPLKRTETFAGISGYIATVTVRQRFVNPYEEPIDAVYRFPLPHNAAVHDFVITIGRRRIRGVIRERAEAERIHRAARSQGLRSILLTQDAPSLFSHRIANLAPKDPLDVELQYFHTLACRDGWYEFHYPLVVRPYVTRRPGETPEPEEPPDERSGRDIALSVAIDAGLPLEDIVSPSHAVEVQRLAGKPHQARVKLRTGRTIANRDFLLRYRVAGDELRSAALFHRSRLSGFFTLMLHPPADQEALPRQPIELVFVVDASGSMRGAPLAKARLAVEHALARLRPSDTFQIIRFADEVERLGQQAVTATEANVARAVAWLGGLEAHGGTELYEGVRAALAMPEPRARLRFLVLLTDGYITRDSDVLNAIARRAGDARVFSVGLGKAPYRYVLERLAQLGRGAVAYIGPGDDPAEAIDEFVARVTRPALTHIEIDWGSLRVADVYPKRLPDVYHGRPVVLVGRFRGKGETTIRIRGRLAGKPREFRLRVDPDGRGPAHTALAPMWARARIADLARELATGATPTRTDEIARLALHFNLLTPLTRFIAIDTFDRPRRKRRATVVPPNLVPQSLHLSPTAYRP